MFPTCGCLPRHRHHNPIVIKVITVSVITINECQLTVSILCFTHVDAHLPCHRHYIYRYSSNCHQMSTDRVYSVLHKCESVKMKVKVQQVKEATMSKKEKMKMRDSGLKHL